MTLCSRSKKTSTANRRPYRQRGSLTLTLTLNLSLHLGDGQTGEATLKNVKPSYKIVKRLDAGRKAGKLSPRKVEMIYKKMNPAQVDVLGQISVICFLKNTLSIPSIDSIKIILKKYRIFPTYVSVFKFDKNVTHCHLRLRHPSMVTLSLIFGPEQGLTFTSHDSTIVARLEIAKSGH